ncbi:MAG: hypothetical protein M5R42_07570 [Rhodocyclaceae bacterium]|nr:hypothetical protein [Rhodocyclaceae bacterium]
MRLAEGRQQARGEIFGGGYHADVEQAAAHPLHRRQCFLRFAQLLGYDAGVARHLDAGLRKKYLLAHLFGQRQPRLVLQTSHLHGDGRLGQVQFLGGARERQVTCHGFENLELAQSDVLHESAPS